MKKENNYRPGILVASEPLLDAYDKRKTPVVITYFNPKTGETTYITAERSGRTRTRKMRNEKGGLTKD